MEEVIKFIKSKSYEVINDHLGYGSCGLTVLLKDNSLDELFVCKKYEPQSNVDVEYFYEMFKKEIKIMFKLNNPNIVRIYNYYLYDKFNTGYILMEYIDGQSIGKCLENSNSTLINSVFVQLIQAFNCLEKNNIVHRDIRESNILVDKNGVVKIIDFGLGKDFSVSTKSQDSLNKVINRLGMEKIPKEMMEGKYTSQTDMFCLAELFNRIIQQNDCKDFKYQHILNKMMEYDSKNRYPNFEEILNQINNKEFSMLDVTLEDRQIYWSFTSMIKDCINYFLSKPKIVVDVDEILKGLAQVIEENVFENTLVDNSSIISVFVKNGYNYSQRTEMEVDTVEKFYNWFKGKDEKYQEIVVNNFRIKLSTIKVKIKEDDLPF